MPKDTNNQKFTAVSDVVAALNNAKNSLLKSSPHPAGNCTVAVDTKAVESLNLVLVRTPSKVPDLISTSVSEQAAVETDIGKKAANIAQTAIKRHFDKKLSGEDYIKLLQKSPMPSVTKEVIKSAQRGDPPISGTAGNYSNQFSKSLPSSLQCEKPQTLKVKLEGINPSGTLFTCNVTDAGNHAEFWAGFSTMRIFIEAHSQGCQQGLLLSKIVDEPIEVEVSLSIGMCQGKGNVDVVNATLIKIMDLRGLTARTIRTLSAQMSLDLDSPSQ